MTGVPMATKAVACEPGVGFNRVIVMAVCAGIGLFPTDHGEALPQRAFGREPHTALVFSQDDQVKEEYTHRVNDFC